MALWGGFGGNSFWGNVGLGDPRRRHSFSAGLMGIAQGLLSERSGEGWAPALGRGFGQARANVVASREELQAEQDREKQEALSAYMREQALDPQTNPYDRQMFEVASQLGSAQQGSFLAQMYSAGAGARQAELSRGWRQIDARTAREESDRLTTERQKAAEGRRAETKAGLFTEQEKQKAAAINLHQTGQDPRATAFLGLNPGDPLPKELNDFYQDYLKRTGLAQMLEAAFDASRGGGAPVTNPLGSLDGQ